MVMQAIGKLQHQIGMLLHSQQMAMVQPSQPVFVGMQTPYGMVRNCVVCVSHRVATGWSSPVVAITLLADGLRHPAVPDGVSMPADDVISTFVLRAAPMTQSVVQSIKSLLNMLGGI